MTAYTVYKITMVIQTVGTSGYTVSVYDEHTGQTLVRQMEPTVSNLRLALDVLESGVERDF